MTTTAQNFALMVLHTGETILLPVVVISTTEIFINVRILFLWKFFKKIVTLGRTRSLH